MKDILQDMVAHTHSLGFLNLVKVTGDDQSTQIDSMAEDRSVILTANTKSPVNEFAATFGMPNLDKLALHLKNPEYQKNEGGDFQNDYRFMNQEIINEKLKSVKFKGASWEVEIEPTIASIQRMKLQSAAHSEETVFTVKTENDNLVFYFGDHSTHAGSFDFAKGIAGALKHAWSWPVAQVQAILGLDGKLTMKISDQGAMQITVDSGLAEYNYILPAQSK